MNGPNREAPTSRFLYADADDFLTPVGQALNADFLGDEEALVRALADAARFDADAARRSPGDCAPPGRGGAQGACGQDRARRVPAAIRPVLAGRRDPDVPRRGAAAHSRRRDGRPADRRQVARRRLGQPPRRQPVAVRQRLDLGPDAHGPHRAARPERRCGTRRRDEPCRRPRRRTGGADRDAPGDAHHGAPVRDGAHHEGGARQLAERTAMRQAMRIMGHQFVMGRNIEEALERSQKKRQPQRIAIRSTCSARRRSPAPTPTRYFDAYRRPSAR